MIVYLLSLVCFLFSCGNLQKEVKPIEHENPLSYVKQKSDMYKSLQKKVRDKHGFIEYDQCDSLLFTSLVYASGSSGVSILSARDEETGRWYRTPYKDCFSNELGNIQSTRRSKSTISKDMFTGLFWAGSHSSRLRGEMKKIYDYGMDHDWIMGEGPFSRVWLSFGLQRTLAYMIGKNPALFPDVWDMPESDHDAHIVILHILLRGKIRGKIDDLMLRVIKKTYDKYPENALFSYAKHLYTDGDMSEPLAVLADDKLFPPDRLPNSKDRCGRWLWERDPESEHWKPCKDSPRRVHSGGELLFLVSLLEASAKK